MLILDKQFLRYLCLIPRKIFRMIDASIFRRKSIIILVLFLFFCISPALYAKSLTCYSTELPPFVITKNGVISGIDVDIVAEAAKRIGIVVDFKLLPWARLENELKKGLGSYVDCAFSFGKNDTRKEYMNFTDTPIKLTSYVLYAKKGSFHSHVDVTALKGKKIGIRRGFIVPGNFEEMRRKNELIVDEIDNDASNFVKLEKDRIDGVITNSEVGSATSSPSQSELFVAIELAIEKVPTYLVFNKEKNLTSDLLAFNKAMKEITNDGTAKKIRDIYLKLPTKTH
jgi:polar amino acid transport system substrate-binding protein